MAKCKKVKRGIKFIWGFMKPEVLRVAVEGVKWLEKVPSQIMSGDMKQDTVVDAMRAKAKELGQDLTMSAARTVSNGVHTMLINGLPIDDLGEPGHEEEDAQLLELVDPLEAGA